MPNSKTPPESFRGTPKGEIRALVSEALARLVDDLDRLDRVGYSENVCGIVKDALKQIRTAAISRAGSTWVAGIANVAGDFYVAYEKWNGAGEMTSRDAILLRREEIDDLREFNRYMSAAFRRNHRSANVVSPREAEFCDIAFAQLTRLAKTWPEYFISLASAVKNRNRRSKRTRG